jgi:hypothetical protein
MLAMTPDEGYLWRQDVLHDPDGKMLTFAELSPAQRSYSVGDVPEKSHRQLKQSGAGKNTFVCVLSGT